MSHQPTGSLRHSGQGSICSLILTPSVCNRHEGDSIQPTRIADGALALVHAILHRKHKSDRRGISFRFRRPWPFTAMHTLAVVANAVEPTITFPAVAIERIMDVGVFASLAAMWTFMLLADAHLVASR